MIWRWKPRNPTTSVASGLRCQGVIGSELQLGSVGMLGIQRLTFAFAEARVQDTAKFKLLVQKLKSRRPMK